MKIITENTDKLEEYSFSKLSSFHTCKYMYKQTYIDHLKGVENAFALYGSFVHSIMERYAKGEIEIWDLPKVYKQDFNKEVYDGFPITPYVDDLRALYYSQGLSFLNNFQGYNKCKILEVESNFKIDMGDWIFTGIMDLLYEDEDGNLVLLDYKSKSSFKNKTEKYKYSRQLYLYCIYVKEKYGKFPDKMVFHMFRKQRKEFVQFNEFDFIEAQQWAKQTVKDIRECKDFSPTCEEFFSEQLCNHRLYCNKKIKK